MRTDGALRSSGSSGVGAGGAPPLHVVTDDEVLARPGFRLRAQRVLEAGAGDVALHVRGPTTAGAALFRMARELRPAAAASGALLMANDRVDLALVLDLAGVHLGERSLPPAVAREQLGAGILVGRSVHDPGPEATASAVGADYLFVGTIFRSGSHPERTGAGPERIAALARRTGLPLFGIGGVTPERVSSVLEAGARGVAVVSGVWDADDPAAAVGRYLDALARR